MKIEKEKGIKLIKKMKINWDKKDRLKFSTNEADSIKYEIIYNQAISDILEKIEIEI